MRREDRITEKLDTTTDDFLAVCREDRREPDPEAHGLLAAHGAFSVGDAEKNDPEGGSAYKQESRKLARVLDAKYWERVTAAAEKEMNRLCSTAAFETWVRGYVKSELETYVQEAIAERSAELASKVSRIVQKRVDEVTKDISRHMVEKVQTRIAAAYANVDLTGVVRKG